MVLSQKICKIGYNLLGYNKGSLDFKADAIF